MKDNFLTVLPSSGKFYKFHMIVHVIKQIEYFGNLRIMDANRLNRFFTVIYM